MRNGYAKHPGSKSALNYMGISVPYVVYAGFGGSGSLTDGCIHRHSVVRRVLIVALRC
jgi:hypothetical protein